MALAGQKAEEKPRRQELEPRPVVRVRPNGYQPSKAEMEEEFTIDASPEELIRAAFRPARVIEDPKA